MGSAQRFETPSFPFQENEGSELRDPRFLFEPVPLKVGIYERRRKSELDPRKSSNHPPTYSASSRAPGSRRTSGWRCSARFQQSSYRNLALLRPLNGEH